MAQLKRWARALAAALAAAWMPTDDAWRRCGVRAGR